MQGRLLERISPNCCPFVPPSTPFSSVSEESPDHSSPLRRDYSSSGVPVVPVLRACRYVRPSHPPFGPILPVCLNFSCLDSIILISVCSAHRLLVCSSSLPFPLPLSLSPIDLLSWMRIRLGFVSQITLEEWCSHCSAGVGEGGSNSHLKSNINIDLGARALLQLGPVDVGEGRTRVLAFESSEGVQCSFTGSARSVRHERRPARDRLEQLG